MSFSSIRRLYFSVLRRLLLLWVRSETIDSSVFLSLRSQVPQVYVLQKPSISDLVVLDNECRKAGLNRPIAPINEPCLEQLASCSKQGSLIGAIGRLRPALRHSLSSTTRSLMEGFWST